MVWCEEIFSFIWFVVNLFDYKFKNNCVVVNFWYVIKMYNWYWVYVFYFK